MDIQLERKHVPVLILPVIKGALIIFWGIMAVVLFQSSPYFLMKSFGVMNLMAGCITLIFTLKYPHLQISNQWLKLETVVELVAGIVFTFLVSTPELFMRFMSYGIFFIIILQFIYGFALMNTGQFRLINTLLRFLTLIAGVVVGTAIFSNKVDIEGALLIIGIFSIIYGVLNVQYGFQLKNVFLGRIR